ncbi:MAG TPA: hypothetical protein VFW92_06645 [Candidatus Limnocylindrales bacterium]|nr:hypothetical protein [Candidatus Limnocylindrales bacterium]
MELDRSVLIAWEADGYAAIQVRAPRRSTDELRAFADSVADLALVHRSAAALRLALRERLPPDPGFEVSPRPRQRRIGDARLVVTLRPPRGEPSPDPA